MKTDHYFFLFVWHRLLWIIILKIKQKKRRLASQSTRFFILSCWFNLWKKNIIKQNRLNDYYDWVENDKNSHKHKKKLHWIEMKWKTRKVTWWQPFHIIHIQIYIFVYIHYIHTNTQIYTDTSRLSWTAIFFLSFINDDDDGEFYIIILFISLNLIIHWW